MADTIWYVDTDFGGSSDGNIATPYKKMSTALAAKHTSTIGVGDRLIFKFKGATADSAVSISNAVAINGDLIMEPQSGEFPTLTSFDLTKYRIDVVDADALTLIGNNITALGMQIRVTAPTGNRSIVNMSSLGTGTTVGQCLIVGDAQATGRLGGLNSAGASHAMFSNVITGCGRAFYGAIRASGANASIFGNTCYDSYHGVRGVSTTVVRNNICADSGPSGDYYPSTCDASSSNNVDTDGTCDTNIGTSDAITSTSILLFEDASSADFNLKSLSPGISAGATLASIYERDLFDAVRTVPWDTGAVLDASIPTPTISDVDGDEIITNGQTGIVITGADFGASQGLGSVKIDGITQTVTSWADTSITITHVLGVMKFGAQTLVVADNALGDGSIAITVNPASGFLFVNLTSVTSSDITAIPALAIGDQLEYEDTTDPDTLPVSVNGGGIISITGDPAGNHFAVRAWDASSPSWGASADQSASGDAPVVGDIINTKLSIGIGIGI